MSGSVDWDQKIGWLRPTFKDYLSDATRLHRQGDIVIDRSLLYRRRFSPPAAVHSVRRPFPRRLIKKKIHAMINHKLYAYYLFEFSSKRVK